MVNRDLSYKHVWHPIFNFDELLGPMLFDRVLAELLTDQFAYKAIINIR